MNVYDLIGIIGFMFFVGFMAVLLFKGMKSVLQFFGTFFIALFDEDKEVKDLGFITEKPIGSAEAIETTIRKLKPGLNEDEIVSLREEIRYDLCQKYNSPYIRAYGPVISQK